MLGTRLVWRRALPAVPDAVKVVARRQLSVYEVYAVRVTAGQGQRRYPFTNLLYQSAAFRAFVGTHFPNRIVVKVMADVGVLEDQQTLKREILL